MKCCNDASTVLPGSPPDPSLHVNYTKGMILGVDDFTQEFAYLAGRSQRIVREFAGYGTTCGLAVTVEDTPDGPRIRISAGSAATPSGKLVCVSTDQCGIINQWLAKAETETALRRHWAGGSPPVSPPVSPPSGPVNVSIYVALCYDDCMTLPVPIPGEPCRSEESQMADSRIADDYSLSLCLDPPVQTEDDALRDFAEWIANVPITDTGPSPSSSERAWVDALQAAAQPWFNATTASPPLSPPPSAATLGDYLFGSPPPGLAIPRTDYPRFLRTALRFWVTRLRPLWAASRCDRLADESDDCVLLARLEVPIIWVGSPKGVWQVDGDATAVVIDESRRPIVVHARLEQEWLLLANSVMVLRGNDE